MPISFANIPANIKVPLYWVEVDPSMAGLPQINLRALLVGVAKGGRAPSDIAAPFGSQAQADAQFGEGSELARMFRAYYANNFANEVWGLPVQASTGSAPATGTINVTAAPTQAGTIHLYISGDYVPVNVLTTDTVTTIGANIADAINAQTQLPVTANATGGTVTLTSVFDSVNANEITVVTNYYGSIGGQQTPIGLVMTLPTNGQLSGGTGTPSFTTAITNLGEEPLRIRRDAVHRFQFAVRMGSGIWLHRSGSLGLDARIVWGRLFGQARHLQRVADIRRHTEQWRRID